MRQPDPLAGRHGLIVTTFYDVEGDYARAGQTRTEVDAIGRILEMERRHGIRSTYNVVARLALDAPNLIQAILLAGNEVASHSYEHGVLPRLARDAISTDLSRSKRVLTALCGDVRGHRCPQSSWDDRVLDALTDEGYSWSAENGTEPYPYRIRPNLWRFPVADDDWRYESDGRNPAVMLETWKARVTAARGQRSHLALGFHAWVEAREERLSALDDFFGWLAALEGVEVMPFGDVLQIMERWAGPALAGAHD